MTGRIHLRFSAFPIDSLVVIVAAFFFAQLVKSVSIGIQQITIFFKKKPISTKIIIAESENDFELIASDYITR